MLIIAPKKFADLDQPEYLDRSLYFVAGPVRGGRDWQQPMLFFLFQYDPDAIVVVPNRWNGTRMLASTFIGEDMGRFERQLDFERHYMERAAWDHPRGCLLFYLHEQVTPRPADEGPYGQDTYGEFARWAVHKKYRPETRLAIGSDQAYAGLDVMVRNLRKDVGYAFPIHESMEMTARAAVAIANQ